MIMMITEPKCPVTSCLAVLLVLSLHCVRRVRRRYQIVFNQPTCSMYRLMCDILYMINIALLIIVYEMTAQPLIH